MAEIADGSLAFASQNGVLQSSDRKLPLSSNQEEIMALFRRIQYSISKGESTATEKKNAGRSEKSPTDSILEVLLRSRKQAKGNLDGYASFSSRTMFVRR